MERSPLEMIRESSLFGGFVHIILSKENVEGGSHRTNDEAQSFIRFLTFELTSRRILSIARRVAYFYFGFMRYGLGGPFGTISTRLIPFHAQLYASNSRAQYYLKQEL